MGSFSRSMLTAGQTAPSFQLLRAGGGSESLPVLLEKGPVLLFMFKISCPVCQMTASFIQRLAASQSVQVVGVSQDDGVSTRRFAEHFGLKIPLLLDSGRDGYPVSNAFGISSVPSLFLIEPDGAISTAFHGFSKSDFEALGERLGVVPFKADETVPAFRAG